jgi:LPS export ABC transporter protein LptC
VKLWDWQALNRQGIAAVIVSAILMIWIYSSLEERSKAPPSPPGHTPDSFMTDFVRTDFDAQGQVHTRLRGEQMDHYADDRSTELSEPVLDVYKDPQHPWHASSASAWVDVQQDVLIMTGHVVVTRDQPDGSREMQVNSESAMLSKNQRHRGQRGRDHRVTEPAYQRGRVSRQPADASHRVTPPG